MVFPIPRAPARVGAEGDPSAPAAGYRVRRTSGEPTAGGKQRWAAPARPTRPRRCTVNELSLADFLAVFLTGGLIIAAVFAFLQRAQNGDFGGWAVGCVACIAAFAGLMLYLMFSGGPISLKP